VLDPAELDFPFSEKIEFQGLEGQATTAADAPAIRAAYLREFRAFRDSLEQACRREQIGYFLVRTDQPLDAALTTILSTKRRTIR
jgi:hypothetical protein